MLITDNPRYLAVLDKFSASFGHWEELEGKTLFLSGASGMLGSFLIDVLMKRNQGLEPSCRCRLIALSRNEAVLRERFSRWAEMEELQMIAGDVSHPLPADIKADYFIHAASTTHPRAYSTEPINTVLSNILGTRNMLDAAAICGARFLLLSSVEIYGENRGDCEYFTEDYCGYLNCNTLRAGYPEAKRVSEAMCQAWIQEKGVDACIVRLPRSYGPTMRMSDSKAIAQFIKNGLLGEDIVLKSAGTQNYSYLYTYDAVMGLLLLLLKGECGSAYNLGDKGSDITLRDLAKTIASVCGCHVTFGEADSTESKGYSTATKALMDASKARELGWESEYTLASGMGETVSILREIYGK